MKPKYQLLLAATLTLAPGPCSGQGTMYVYDQQSSVEGSYQEGGAAIQQDQPLGQSFTPALSSVGFVRFYVYNGLLGDTTAATILVNLRSESISGPILGSSASVTVSGSFAAPVNFTFNSPVSVTPGTTYYFQPLVLDNNNLGMNGGNYGYVGGTAIVQGAASPGNDFWFREGLIAPVPEPPSAALLLAGGGLIFCYRRRGQ